MSKWAGRRCCHREVRMPGGITRWVGRSQVPRAPTTKITYKGRSVNNTPLCFFPLTVLGDVRDRPVVFISTTREEDQISRRVKPKPDGEGWPAGTEGLHRPIYLLSIFVPEFLPVASKYCTIAPFSTKNFSFVVGSSILRLNSSRIAQPFLSQPSSGDLSILPVKSRLPDFGQ